MAIISHGKVLWLGPHGVHDAFIKLSLFFLQDDKGGVELERNPTKTRGRCY